MCACSCAGTFISDRESNDIEYMCTLTNYREVVSLMDFTMTNKKAALELPPIELQRAIKMLSSQVYFLPLHSRCAIRVCSCIVRLCSCVDVCIIDTTPFFDYNTKLIDLKGFLLRYFHFVESMHLSHVMRASQ